MQERQPVRSTEEVRKITTEAMERATGKQGGEAREAFQEMIAKVATLMLSDTVTDRITVKKGPSGRVLKIKGR